MPLHNDHHHATRPKLNQLRQPPLLSEGPGGNALTRVSFCSLIALRSAVRPSCCLWTLSSSDLRSSECAWESANRSRWLATSASMPATLSRSPATSMSPTSFGSSSARVQARRTHSARLTPSVDAASSTFSSIESSSRMRTALLAMMPIPQGISDVCGWVYHHHIEGYRAASRCIRSFRDRYRPAITPTSPAYHHDNQATGPPCPESLALLKRQQTKIDGTGPWHGFPILRYVSPNATFLT